MIAFQGVCGQANAFPRMGRVGSRRPLNRGNVKWTTISIDVRPYHHRPIEQIDQKVRCFSRQARFDGHDSIESMFYIFSDAKWFTFDAIRLKFSRENGEDAPWQWSGKNMGLRN